LFFIKKMVAVYYIQAWLALPINNESVIGSDVPARLGLKAAALAWLLTAWAFKI
jgi:hypothetical protein